MKFSSKSTNFGKKIELKYLILALGFKKKNEYWKKNQKHLCFIDYFPKNELKSLIIDLGIKLKV